MKKPIPFSTIGAFVLAALCLLIVGILFIGSGQFFKTSQEYVLFFDQSVNGLSVGAPVKFRGVEIGSVDRIALGQAEAIESPKIAVFVRVYRSSSREGIGPSYDFSNPEQVDALVDQGLRAELKSNNLLAGDLYVGLDIWPGEPLRRVLSAEASAEEIPTLKSGLLEDFAASSTDVSQSLIATLENLQRVLTRMDERLDPLTEESIHTMQGVRSLVNTVDEFMDPDSPFGYQVPKTLQEIERAAKSIRQLADYLERNPSSVFFGKSDVEVVTVE